MKYLLQVRLITDQWRLIIKSVCAKQDGTDVPTRVPISQLMTKTN